MRAKYKILFPIETTARELLYKLTLSIEFASLGYQCFLGSKDEISRLMHHVKPFVYFDKGFHAGVSEKLYSDIKQLGGVIVNLDEEGGVDYKDFSTIAMRYSGCLFDNVDLVCFWGTRQKEFLRKNRKEFDEEKTIVSGHPRFDLLKREYRALYDQDVRRIKEAYGDYILINTNMGLGNNIRGDSFVKENYGSRRKNLDEIMDFAKKKVVSFIELVKAIAPSYSGNIIVRPHPEESHDVYLDALGHFDNVHVIYRGSAVPWVIGAELTIHPDCTTGIEALMLGKTSISYLPVVSDTVLAKIPVELSYQCNDKELLLKMLQEKSYPEVDSKQMAILDEIFAFSQSSMGVVVKSVDELIGKRHFDESASDLPPGYSLKRNALVVLAKLYHRLRRRQLELYNKKLGGLEYGNVSDMFHHIKKVRSVDVPVTLEAIAPQLFAVSMKSE